jgi:anaerobic ribonucleoside-triphosphate reductase activating protein
MHYAKRNTDNVINRSNELSTVRIAGVIKESIVDGSGIRYVIFAQGCPHHCRGCHNEATLDFEGGEEYELEKIINDIEKNPMLSGVTFSGGEPFSQPEAFFELAKKLKEKNKNIITYTGYTYDELLEMSKESDFVKGLLEYTDELIDGRFVLEKKDLQLQFKGSTNQRHIDMNATRATGNLHEPIEISS